MAYPCAACGGAAAHGFPCSSCIGGIASCCDGIGGDCHEADMRARYVMRDGALVPIELAAPRFVPQRSALPAPIVQSDIEPYRSMRTGEMITGRAQHREHLSRYNLTEVGNEYPAPPNVLAGPAPGEIAQDIKRELARDPVERRAIVETVAKQPGYDGRILT